MSDERRPPPPPPSRLTLITEDDIATDTERLPAPPAPPRMPEPFRRLRDTAKQPATLRELAERVYSCEAAARETLALGRKLGLEMDGLVTAVNTRFNIFHQELSLLRHDVTRVEAGVGDAVDVAIEERLPLSQRAKRIAMHGSKFAGLTLLGGAITEFWHQYGDIILSLLNQGAP